MSPRPPWNVRDRGAGQRSKRVVDRRPDKRAAWEASRVWPRGSRDLLAPEQAKRNDGPQVTLGTLASASASGLARRAARFAAARKPLRFARAPNARWGQRAVTRGVSGLARRAAGFAAARKPLRFARAPNARWGQRAVTRGVSGLARRAAGFAHRRKPRSGARGGQIPMGTTSGNARRPQRDLNPCCSLERAESWASRRWGRVFRVAHHSLGRSG